MCGEECCFADVTQGLQSSQNFSSVGYNLEANPVKTQHAKFQDIV